MISFFKKAIDFFIPEHIKLDVYIYNKAKAFISLVLFFAILAIKIILLRTFLLIVNVPNIELGMIACIFLLIGFKWNGNLVVFSNLFVLAYLSIIIPSIPLKDGLYSDNLQWVIITPLIALLFGNKISSAFWFVFILISCYIYYCFTDSPTNANFPFIDRTPYFINLIILQLTIYVIVLIFEKGLDLIIKKLKEQKQELENHQWLLEEQNRLLEIQKNKFIVQQKEILEKNADLELMEEKLIYSNKELENFAYAASHDLKEPLRMIGMYTQLMKRKLSDKLDNTTNEFMFFITDGVNSMQNLLDDLLQYSRLGKKDDGVKMVDLNNVLFLVINNLTVAMKESNAAVIAERLPKALASHCEMVQLFQNLIANAIKFRRKDVETTITIMVDEFEDYYQFSFKDNGIGIKEEYKEKVFNIFEKLHSKSEYEGSGIGLATVKKIITNAGGKVWLNSTEGVGTTFHFILPRVKEENILGRAQASYN